MNDCLFCKIVVGTVSSHRVWEGGDYLAFLSIFPNTEGVTIVIPKHHYPSYAFDLPDEVLTGLVLAAKQVAKRLDAGLSDVGRTALVFEGFGVDHVHAKLFPMHGTADMADWRPIEHRSTEYFDTYPGYISSHDAPEAESVVLAELARRLSEQ